MLYTFKQLVGLWENGWRGKVKRGDGKIINVTDNGFMIEPAEVHMPCNQFNMQTTYKKVFEPQKLTCQEALTKLYSLAKNEYIKNHTGTIYENSRFGICDYREKDSAICTSKRIEDIQLTTIEITNDWYLYKKE